MLTLLAVRIALDGTLWNRPTTGISLYAKNLHRALRELGEDVEPWIPSRGQGATRFVMGEVPARLERERPDVFHAVGNFNLPLRKAHPTRFVLTVHDLIPLLLPDTVSATFRWQFRLWLGRSLRVADAVICVSDTTRRALAEAFEVRAPLFTIHHGVDHVDRVAEPDAISLKWLDALGLGNFVLYAGALDARKNVEAAIEACRRLSATLVLAGQPWFGSGSVDRKVSEARAAGADVRAVGHLPDPLFYGLMKRARALVFPSRYEGFGLPPLEAMRLGVPAIVSTRGALPEVCGDGAQQVDPDDVEGLALAIQRADSTWVARGRERAARFSWRRTAELTLEAYRSSLR